MRLKATLPLVCGFTKVLSQVVLVGSLTLFWLQLLVRGWKNSGDVEHAKLEIAEESRAIFPNETASDEVAQTRNARQPTLLQGDILRLSSARFQERSNGSLWLQAYVDAVQVARVPQTASRHLSVVARLLVGCTSPTDVGTSSALSSCRRSGHPPVACGRDHRVCDRVVGSADHLMDAAVLADEFTLSLSQLRSPVERLISAFLFESHSHSPPCARQGSTNESQVQECLGNVIQMQSSRNVAARVYTAHDIHPNISACDRASVNLTEDGNDDVDFEEMVIHDVGGAEAGECEESVGSVLAALCRFNHVALTEAPGVSTLLLFETVPWVTPHQAFFPHLSGSFPGDQSAATNEAGLEQAIAREESGDARMPLKIDSIGANMRDMAAALNKVLYDFVLAKLCSRLGDLGLSEHPSVVAELVDNSLADRCFSPRWYGSIIETHAEFTQGCRLFEALPPPQPPPS